MHAGFALASNYTNRVVCHVHTLIRANTSLSLPKPSASSADLAAAVSSCTIKVLSGIGIDAPWVPRTQKSLRPLSPENPELLLVQSQLLSLTTTKIIKTNKQKQTKTTTTTTAAAAAAAAAMCTFIMRLLTTAALTGYVLT